MLSTQYLGIKLKNPLVASAGPMTKSLKGILNLAEGNPGAIVLHSLFEEQINAASIELDHYMSSGTESTGEALTYFPEIDSYEVGPDLYLEHIHAAKARTDVPIIGSLNGVSEGGWIEYAKLMEEAGIDALELNIYYLNADPAKTAQDIEMMYQNVVQDVAKSINVPVAVKLSPFLTSVPNMCLKLSSVGAKGFVLFNRFYQPDLDINELEVVHNLELSTSSDLRLPLRWTAMLYDKVDADIAISGGIHTGIDVIKGIMAGATVTMMTAEVLKGGIGRFDDINNEVRQWMEENEYLSVAQMRGSLSQKNSPDPSAYERANYMRVLQSIKQDPTGKLF